MCVCVCVCDMSTSTWLVVIELVIEINYYWTVISIISMYPIFMILRQI